MLLHPTPSMEPSFFMQPSMETRRSHQCSNYILLKIINDPTT